MLRMLPIMTSLGNRHERNFDSLTRMYCITSPCSHMNAIPRLRNEVVTTMYELQRLTEDKDSPRNHHSKHPASSSRNSIHLSARRATVAQNL